MDNLDIKRHSLAHVLAFAIKQLYGQGVKLAIGPTIDNGLYYDFDFGETKIGEQDLKQIEKKMKHIIKQKLQFERQEMTIAEAIDMEKERNEDYKVELIQDLKKTGETKVSYYKMGDFIDLCKGPHINSTSELDKNSFKISSLAGAYWRGDEKNKMLTRVYVWAFSNQEELKEYEERVKQAEERDHRKLGRELDLFYFSELVGPGLPLFTPKGTVIKEELQKKIEKICRDHGFEKVMTPHLAKLDLYKLSGHADKFSDELFHVTSKYKQDYVMKPVQCPHQTQIYNSKTRSYRDLPIRYMESDKQYRAEKPGQIGGLNRVIAITVEDGHSFCRVHQIKDEIKNIINIIKDFYSSLGLWEENHWISLSVRDYNHLENYIGEEGDWNECENILKEIDKIMELNAHVCEGEAALYGPKIDFMFKDALGRELQVATVQLDFATPKRFNLVYTDEQGKEQNPVMIHRAILGSYERFLMILLEHFKGAFPIWLSPVQVKLISVGKKHIDGVKKMADEFKQEDIRVETDLSEETVGNKIRKATQEKIPYVLVIGDKELNSNTLNVRERGQEDTVEISKEEFIKEVKGE